MSIIEGRDDSTLVPRGRRPPSFWFNKILLGGVVATPPQLKVFKGRAGHETNQCTSFKLRSAMNSKARAAFCSIWVECWQGAEFAHSMLSLDQNVLVTGQLRLRSREGKPGIYTVRCEELTLIWNRPTDRVVLVGDTATLPRSELQRLRIIEQHWQRQQRKAREEDHADVAEALADADMPDEEAAEEES